MDIANIIAAAILAGITLTVLLIILIELVYKKRQKLIQIADIYQIQALAKNDAYYTQRKKYIGIYVSPKCDVSWNGPWASGTFVCLKEDGATTKTFTGVLLKKV